MGQRQIFPFLIAGIVLSCAFVAVLVMLQGQVKIEQNTLGKAVAANNPALSSYAPPWDSRLGTTQYLVSEQLANGSLNITVRKDAGVIDQYVYRTGYYTRTVGGVRQWEQFTFPAAGVGTTQWIRGTAQFLSPPLTGVDVQEYAIIFVCRKYTLNGTFICGPRNSTGAAQWTIDLFSTTCANRCGGICANLSSDASNCGACGIACAASTPICAKGSCMSLCSSNPTQFCNTTVVAGALSLSSLCDQGSCSMCQPGFARNGSSCVPIAANSCIIVGLPFANGAVNPSNSCQSCDVSGSISSWTNRSGACTVANATGTCQAGQCIASCVSSCTLGATQCSGTAVQTCVQVGSCSQWSAAAACAAGQSCSATTNRCEIVTPATTCTSVSGQFCAAVSPSNAAAGSGSCTSGQFCYRCASGFTYSNGQCVSSCVSNCAVSGMVQCVSAGPTGQYQMCLQTSGGCLQWGQSLLCATGQVCAGQGVCQAAQAACTATAGQFCSSAVPTNSNTAMGSCTSGQCYSCRSGFTNQSGQCIATACPQSITQACNAATSCTASVVCGGQTYFCRSMNGGMSYSWLTAAQAPCTSASCSSTSVCNGVTYYCASDAADPLVTWRPCVGSSCSNGMCGVCTDPLSCTDDFVSNGVCSHTAKLNTCLISNQCYAPNDPNPSNSCQYCSTGSQIGWTNRVDGSSCTISGQSGSCVAGQCQEAITLALSHSPSGGSLPVGSTVTMTATTSRAASITISGFGVQNSCVQATSCSVTQTFTTSNYYFYSAQATAGTTVQATGVVQISSCQSNADCPSSQFCAAGSCRNPSCADMEQCVGAGRCGSFPDVCGTTSDLSDCGCSGTDACHWNQYCAPRCGMLGGTDCAQYGKTCETSSGRCV